MKRAVGLCGLGLLAALLPPACGSEDGTKKVPHLTPAGQGGEGGAAEPASGGMAPGEGGVPGEGSKAGAGGAGGVETHSAGAGGVPTPSEAGAPATGGANGGAGGSGSEVLGGAGGSGGELLGGEGGSGGEGISGNVVYASFGTKLVWLEPETGKLHEVGDMRSAQGNVTYAEVVFAYGNVPGEAWIVTPRYDATANQPPPELGKLNLCTGVVTELSTLTRVGTAPTALEGLAMHPNGTWYVSTGINPANGTQYLTNKLGTLNVTTRVITDLTGTVDTLTDDMDSMDFVGSTLYGIDVNTTAAQLELVTANLTTGAVSSVATPASASATAVPLRFAYDSSRSTAYSWRQSDRNLLAMSLVNGTVTAIGETHPANVYPGEVIQGFMVAPVCP